MNYFVFSYIYFDLIPTEVHIATYQLHIYERLFEQIHIFRFLVCDTPKKILQNFAGIEKKILAHQIVLKKVTCSGKMAYPPVHFSSGASLR